MQINGIFLIGGTAQGGPPPPPPPPMLHSGHIPAIRIKTEVGNNNCLRIITDNCSQQIVYKYDDLMKNISRD